MVLALSFLVAFVVQGAQPDCATWADCREQAEAARASDDVERFHDLAWRAVQKGKPNDPELMLLLARAQSLSGRPLDALVMLRRVVRLGFRPDVAGDDFRRVRGLPGWAELEAELAGAPPAAEVPSPAATTREAPTPPPAAAAPSVAAKTAAAEPAPKPASTPPATVRRGAETLRMVASSFTPSGLVYDAVSRRFIVGDQVGRRLSVVDESSHGMTTLASARGAGFGEVSGLAVDAREGTLWVVSHGEEGSRLHKLQLISARELGRFEPPKPVDEARFADVVMDARAGPLVLDAGGQRVLRLAAGGAALQVAAPLDAPAPVSLAPAGNAVVYVAHGDGLTRLNLANAGSSAVTAADGLSLTGLTRIRWHDGSLVGIQRTGSGEQRAIRLRLARDGRSVTALDILDDGIETAEPGALTLAGNTLYYVARQNGATVIREVVLQR